MTEATALLAGGPLNGASFIIRLPDNATPDVPLLFPDPDSQAGAHFVYFRAYPDDETQPWIFRFDAASVAVVPGKNHPAHN